MNSENLLKKWVTTTCSDGEACWCRIILVADADPDNLENAIICSGAVHKEMAEHIVKVHNDSLVPVTSFAEISPPKLDMDNVRRILGK